MACVSSFPQAAPTLARDAVAPPPGRAANGIAPSFHSAQRGSWALGSRAGRSSPPSGDVRPGADEDQCAGAARGVRCGSTQCRGRATSWWTQSRNADRLMPPRSRAASTTRGSRRPSPPCRARISLVRLPGTSARAASLAGTVERRPRPPLRRRPRRHRREPRHQQRPAVAARAVDRRAQREGGRDGRPDRRRAPAITPPSWLISSGRRAGWSPTRSNPTSPSAPRPTWPAFLRSRSVPVRASKTLPKADAIYVNAAASHPPRAWLDALKVGGRLIFPLQAAHSTGAMLLITRPERGDVWPARLLSGVVFIACEGGQDPAMGRKVDQAFRRGRAERVRSLRFGAEPSRSDWLQGRRLGAVDGGCPIGLRGPTSPFCDIFFGEGESRAILRVDGPGTETMRHNGRRRPRGRLRQRRRGAQRPYSASVELPGCARNNCRRPKKAVV